MASPFETSGDSSRPTQAVVSLENLAKLRISVATLALKVDNLGSKVEGIEVTVETAVMGVLKEVFGLQDPPINGGKPSGDPEE